MVMSACPLKKRHRIDHKSKLRFVKFCKDSPIGGEGKVCTGVQRVPPEPGR